MYLLKKEEYKIKYGHVKERKLIHCTTDSAVKEIIKDNFNWRLVVRGKYGIGTSFSPNADYANCHANRQNGWLYILLVLKTSNKA